MFTANEHFLFSSLKRTRDLHPLDDVHAEHTITGLV